MSWPLVNKEAQEHGVIVLIALALGGFLLLGCINMNDRYGGRFGSFVYLMGIYAPLLALTLSNRLLASEYTGRTQLFLEVLPVTRLRVFATKWLLGAAVMLGMIFTSWFSMWQSVLETEGLALLPALVSLGCFELFTLTLWSFAALAGMLGRYRYLVWLMGVLSLGTFSNWLGVPWRELPVLRLLGEDVAMARSELLPIDLLVPLGMTLACALAAATLGLYGSGSIPSLLAQRMTARERVFVSISILGVLVALSALEPKPVKPLFALTSGERATGKHASAAVLPTSDFDVDAARGLAKLIVQDVDTLIDALRLQTQTSIAITPQQGLDPYVMQRASLGGSDGIVLRMAPDAPLDLLRGLVLHSLLLDYTRGRAHKEDRHVLLDGLSAYWALQDDSAARERWWLRAAAPATLDADALSHWSQTVEELGDCVSYAVAFGTFDLMAEELGRDRLLQIMREVFVQPPDDARALFERNPTAALERAGLTWPVLATKLAAAREKVRAQHAELATRAAIKAEVSWRNDREQGLVIETNVSGVDAYRVLYTQLTPWASDIGEMPRMDVRNGRAVLPLSPARGARVLTTIEIDDPLLGCPVRVLARRVTLQ